MSFLDLCFSHIAPHFDCLLHVGFMKISTKSPSPPRIPKSSPPRKPSPPPEEGDASIKVPGPSDTHLAESKEEHSLSQLDSVPVDANVASSEPMAPLQLSLDYGDSQIPTLDHSSTNYSSEAVARHSASSGRAPPLELFPSNSRDVSMSTGSEPTSNSQTAPAPHWKSLGKTSLGDLPHISEVGVRGALPTLPSLPEPPNTSRDLPPLPPLPLPLNILPQQRDTSGGLPALPSLSQPLASSADGLSTLPSLAHPLKSTSAHELSTLPSLPEPLTSTREQSTLPISLPPPLDAPSGLAPLSLPLPSLSQHSTPIKDDPMLPVAQLKTVTALSNGGMNSYSSTSLKMDAPSVDVHSLPSMTELPHLRADMDLDDRHTKLAMSPLNPGSLRGGQGAALPRVPVLQASSPREVKIFDAAHVSKVSGAIPLGDIPVSTENNTPIIPEPLPFAPTGNGKFGFASLESSQGKLWC